MFSGNKSYRWAIFPVIGAMLLAIVSTNSIATAQASCGSTYTVQPGDNLTNIANLCGVSLSALEQANPQIVNTNLVFPGQIIHIPQGVIPITGALAQVSLSSYNGGPGAQVKVSGSAFPANTALNVSLAQQGASVVSTAAVTTDSNGNFSTQVTIPSNAGTGSVWIVMAAAQASGGASATAQFQVVSSSASGPYTVESGDTLTGIAGRFDTTVNALLRANPQLSSANMLTVREQIDIPGSLVNINGRTVYIVKSGDYLSEIATNEGTTLAALEQANPQISDPSLIYAGEYVYIP